MTTYEAPYTRSVLTWVDSEEEARRSYVVPGTIGFFMEKNNPRFYIKEQTSFRTFEFKEIIPEPVGTTQYVTEDKFYAAIEDLKSYISNQNRKPYRNKENNDAKSSV